MLEKVSVLLDCPIVPSEEFVAVDDDNVDSCNENEMNNVAPVPTSSEMRNIMKSVCNYLDTHSNSEMNNEMDDIKQFDAKKLKSLSISKYMISILKAHCHPPINDRSIANASCTAIGSPPLKSRPSLQAQVSKTMKIRVPDRG
ncbi:hypothetical protein TNCV_535801 [Trichonephila clavipes]|nr:hypothetical protein TNCV_535801 [Trichonephila clavipes]